MNKKEKEPKEESSKRLFSIAGWDVYVSINEVSTEKDGRTFHFSSLKSALWDIVQVEGDKKLSKEKDIELRAAVKILTETRDELWREIGEKIDERFPSGKIGKYEI